MIVCLDNPRKLKHYWTNKGGHLVNQIHNMHKPIAFCYSSNNLLENKMEKYQAQ